MTRLLLSSFVLVLCSCSAPRLNLAGRYGALEQAGQVGVSGMPDAGVTSFAEVGLVGEEAATTLTADLKWGSPHLRLSAQSASYSGSGVLNSDIELNGGTLSAGEEIRSTMDTTVQTIAITFDLVPTDFVEFGIGIGVTLLDLGLSFEAVDSEAAVATDSPLPIPIGAVNAAVWLGPIELSGFFGGVAVSTDEGKASHFDLDITARWSFLGEGDGAGGSLEVGWRQVRLAVEFEDGDDNLNMDFTQTGPYVGLSFHL